MSDVHHSMCDVALWTGDVHRGKELVQSRMWYVYVMCV